MDESNRGHHATSIRNGTNVHFLFPCLVQSSDMAGSSIVFLALFHWPAASLDFVRVSVPDSIFLPRNLLCGSEDGYEPPNFDTIVKTKKIEKKKKDELRQLQFFSSEAPGNQQIRFRNIDPTQVKQIVVPSNVMQYRNRFYDWPPEPKYCRVYASEAPSNLLVPGYTEDTNGYGYESDSTYVFDQAARMREEEERRKAMQKKKRARKKGVGRKFTDGVMNATQMGIGAVEMAGGAVIHGTEQVLGVTADVTVGAVKGTAHLTKTVVKGTRKGTISAVKGTGNLLRLRKKNKYKSPYSDDDEDYYY